jgi:hypothetical protein
MYTRNITAKIDEALNDTPAYLTDGSRQARKVLLLSPLAMESKVSI